MSVITNLDIVLAAKTGDLDRGLDGGRKKLNDFGNDARNASTHLAGFAPAATLATNSLNNLINTVPGLALAVDLFRDMRAAAIAANAARVASDAASLAKVAADTKSAAAVTITAVAATKVATETRDAANEAREFLMAMVAAAMAAQSIKLSSGRGLSPDVLGPRAFVRQPARIGGPVARPDFQDVGIDIKPVTAASTAVAGLGITGTAAMGALAVGIGAAIAGAVGLAIAIGKVNAEMVAIDNAADKANQLGVSYAELAVLRGALGKESGLEDSAIDDAIKKFEVNLVEAAETGKGKAAESLAQLGLNAQELLAKGPKEAIKEIAGSFDNINGKAQQLAAAKNLFGNVGSQLVGALRSGSDAIDDWERTAGQIGLLLSDAQAEQVGAANDAWQDVSNIATGFWRQISAEVAPIIQVVSEGLFDWLEPLGGVQFVLPAIVDNLAYAAGVMFDIYEYASLTYKTMGNIATLNFSQIGEDWSAALSFDHGDEFVKNIQAARAAAKQAADEKGANRLYGADAASDLPSQKLTAAAEERLALQEKQNKAREDHLTRLRDEVALLQETVRLGEDAANAAADRRKFISEVGNNPRAIAEFDRLAAAKADAEAKMAKAERDKKEAEKARERADDFKKKADELVNEFKAPQVLLSEKLSEIDRMFKEKLIDGATGAKAAEAARREFISAMDLTIRAPAPSVGAVQGVAAYSQAIANDKAMRQENLQAQVVKLTETTNALLEKILNRAPQALNGV